LRWPRRIIGWRCTVRRLYSTFAGSWPGIGLLLMRLVTGSIVIVRAAPHLWTDGPLHMTLGSASVAGSGLLLIAGLWTPVAGAVLALIEISQILRGDEDPLLCLLSAGIAGGLAMLGPGRWSVDARLFGWKRIEPPRATTRSGAR
jgi:putative oxidoreductase